MAKGEESRDKILEAAFQLFIRNGYHGSSMRAIAKAAGLAPGSIYNHFEGKEDIFSQVLLRHHPIHYVLPILEKSEGADAEALIRNVTGEVYSIIRQRNELLHLLFIEIVEFEGRHFSQIFELGGAPVLAFITKLQTSKSQLRPISTGNIFLGTVSLVLSQWLLETGFLSNTPLPGTENHFETAVDIFLHGILARPTEA